MIDALKNLTQEGSGSKIPVQSTGSFALAGAHRFTFATGLFVGNAPALRLGRGFPRSRMCVRHDDPLRTDRPDAGWFSTWGYPAARIEPAMAWMDMLGAGRMPGMATYEQLNQLRNSDGREAERRFLLLMIANPRSGVALDKAVPAKMNRSCALAQSIVNAQTSEIAFMQAYLEKKGFPPVPEEENMISSAVYPMKLLEVHQ